MESTLTLSDMVWVVSNKQLPTNNDGNELWSQSRNDMNFELQMQSTNL